MSVKRVVKVKDVNIRVDARFVGVIQHALSTASHHYHQCAMFDNAKIRPGDRLAQIQAYDQVFQRLLEVEVKNGWRRPEKRKQT